MSKEGIVGEALRNVRKGIAEVLGTDEERDKSRFDTGRAKPPQEELPATLDKLSAEYSGGGKYSEQEFLLEFYDKISNEEQQTRNYNNFSKINVENAMAVNALMNRKAGFNLNELTPAQMSLLVPKFRLEKVRTVGNNVEKIGEFRFDDTTHSVDKIFRGKDNSFTKAKGKTDIVGLESFTWEDLGSLPGYTGVTFKANLSIILSNMTSLFTEKGSDKDGNPIKFEDLLSFEPSKSENPEYNVERTRIRVTVGWTLGEASAKEIAKLGVGYNNLTADDINRAVKSSTVSMFLNLLKHDFSINENGMIKLSIDYIASIEALMSLPKADVFDLENDKKLSNLFDDLEDVKVRITELKQQQTELAGTEEQGFFSNFTINRADGARALEDLNTVEKIKEKKDPALRGELLSAQKAGLPEQIEKLQTKKGNLQKEIEEYKETRLLDLYSSVVDGLIAQGSMLYVDLNEEQLTVFKKLRELDKSGLSGEQLKEQKEKAIKVITLKRGQNSNFRVSRICSDTVVRGDLFKKGEEAERFYYFHLGDLLNLSFGRANDNLNKRESDKHPKVNFLLGNINFIDQRSNNVIKMNLADIPISLKRFSAWFNDSVVKTKRSSYNIRDFIRDAVDKLVINCLNNVSSESNTPISISKLVTKSVSLPGKTPLSDNKTFDKKDLSDLVSWGGNSSDFTEYFFIYCHNYSDKNMKGVRSEDEEQNIIHLIMGADRGLLINTSLSRQDLPLQTEVSIERAAREGTVGSTIYSDKYNVDLTLVGNTLFAPGMAFYLDPTVLGIGKPGQANSLASKMGIGGYYRVLSTECSISSGKFETIIKGNLELYGSSISSDGGGTRNSTRQIQSLDDGVPSRTSSSIGNSR